MAWPQSVAGEGTLQGMSCSYTTNVLTILHLIQLVAHVGRKDALLQQLAETRDQVDDWTNKRKLLSVCGCYSTLEDCHHWGLRHCCRAHQA